MISLRAMNVTELNDADLVAESLGGNREAFGQIVERYQTLITSLAYCATGNVSQSEDLAQQTFVSAWKQLGELREPAKLRPWLCSLTRFLISKEFRRLGREPVHAAESLEGMDESIAPEPLPPDQVISDEEKEILWRSLERIPEIYREPLVLFYREHQSIEAVARDLELSEDTVKQRLSRGRKLLQEQFLAFVAGALKQTTPGKTFTLGVLAALPLVTTTAKAATVTATATKGGAMAKATGVGAFLQALLAVSPIMLLGGYFGFKMGGDARQSRQQRESVVAFWRMVVGSLAVFIVLPVLVLLVLNILPVNFTGDFKLRMLNGLTWWLGLMYVVVPAALIRWAWQRRKIAQTSVGELEVAGNSGNKKRLWLWVILATVGAAVLLGLVFADSNYKVQNVTAAEIQKIASDGRGKQPGAFCILQSQNSFRQFFVTVRDGGKTVRFSAPVDDATLALVQALGIPCPTYVAGRDYEIFGWPGKLLPVFCIFILAIGGFMLLRWPGKFKSQEMDARKMVELQRAERLGNQVFGTVIALGMIALSLLMVLFMMAHHAAHISGVEAGKMIMENKDARFSVFQFNDGSKELHITLVQNHRARGFIAPVDESTLTLLADNQIVYKTYVQGQDFGFRDPSRWILVPGVFILALGAMLILRGVWKKRSQFPVAVRAA